MEPIGVLGEAQKNSPEESVSGEQPDGRRTQLTQGLQEDVVEDTDALGTGASQRWPQVVQGAAVQSVGIYGGNIDYNPTEAAWKKRRTSAAAAARSLAATSVGRCGL